MMGPAEVGDIFPKDEPTNVEVEASAHISVGPLSLFLSWPLSWVTLYGYGLRLRHTKAFKPLFSEARFARGLRLGPYCLVKMTPRIPHHYTVTMSLG